MLSQQRSEETDLFLFTCMVEIIDHIPAERIGEPQSDPAYIVCSNEFMERRSS